MDFELTQAQKEFVSLAKAFATKRLKPLVARMDAEAHYDLSLIPELAELGFFGLMVPEELGGVGLDTLTYALLIEELSKVCPSTAVMLSVHNSLMNETLVHLATPAQRQRWLPKTASGQVVGAFAITEPGAGSDAGGTRLKAVPDGDCYVLNGTKTFITNAEFAGLFIVFASTNPAAKTKGITAFFVEKGTPGFEVGKKEDKMGLRASCTNELLFSDARVPAENRIGEVGEGFKVAMRLLDGGRIGIAAQALGIAEAAMAEALDYVQNRSQFGHPIAEFQGIQWMLADMATEIEAARLLIHRAATLRDRGKPSSQAASMAKLFASETSNRVVNRALQMFGGYGYIKDYPIERIYRDQRVTQLYEGTSEIQRLVIARSLFPK